jgi:16S rRNA (guanine527-N7)-methyltransferase
MASAPISEDRIAELLGPFLDPASLSPHQLRQVSIYLDLLLRWNARIGLTAVRDPEEIVTRHFGESFFAARQLFSPDAPSGSAIDIGSGAGFPGLPLKIFSPQLELTLVESNNKKVAFLREVMRALDLATGVRVLASRAEEIEASATLVTLRAVERFENALLIARKLISPNGRIALLIGSSQRQTAESSLPDLRWGKPIALPLSNNRILLIGAAERT